MNKPSTLRETLRMAKFFFQIYINETEHSTYMIDQLTAKIGGNIKIDRTVETQYFNEMVDAFIVWVIEKEKEIELLEQPQIVEVEEDIDEEYFN